jgi:hypothetical protein
MTCGNPFTGIINQHIRTGIENYKKREKMNKAVLVLIMSILIAGCAPATPAGPTLTPTITKTPTNTLEPYQITRTAFAATQSYFKSFSEVSAIDFTTYPDKYENNRITFTCTVFNVINSEQFQCRLEGEPVFVVMDHSFGNIYEDSVITVYGIGAGTHCGKNALGGEVCQPLVYGKN